VLFRKQVGDFLYNPWDKIELKSYPTTPTYCIASNNLTGIFVLGKLDEIRGETNEIFFDPKDLNSFAPLVR